MQRMGLDLVLVAPFRDGSDEQLKELRRRPRVLDDALATIGKELAPLDDEGPAPVLEKIHVVGRPRRRGWTSTYDRAHHLIRMESALTGAVEELPLPQLLRRPEGMYFIDSDGDLARAIPEDERARIEAERQKPAQRSFFARVLFASPRQQQRRALIDEETQLCEQRDVLLARIEALRVDPLTVLRVRRVGDDDDADALWMKEQMATCSPEDRARWEPIVRARLATSRGAPVYTSTPFPEGLPDPPSVGERLSLFVGPAAMAVARAGALEVAERMYDLLDPRALAACADAFTDVADRTTEPERVHGAARWMRFWASQSFSAMARG